MKINRENYEAFLLDYFEHSLDPASVAELMLFLEVNPDLKAEFEDYEPISLIPDTQLHYPGKDRLKKPVILAAGPINGSNYEEYFISAVENLLSEHERSLLGTFLSLNPGLQPAYTCFMQTKLTADSSVVFPDKDSLRRTNVIPFFSIRNRTFLYTAAASAAALLILLSVYISNPPHVNSPSVALKQDSRVYQKPQHQTAPARQEPRQQQDQPSQAMNHSSTHIPATPATQRAVIQPETNDNIPALMATAPAPSIQTPSGIGQDQGIEAGSRTYFTDVYQFIRLRETVDYQMAEQELQNKSLLARGMDLFREKVLGQDLHDSQKRTSDQQLWMLANAGVKGINYLTNSHLELRRNTDSEGNTTAYAIASGRFEYSRDLRK